MSAVISAPPTELEFREQRRKYLGGSDIAAVLGMSPWRTPLQLWEDKTKPPVESPRDAGKAKVLSRGKLWEPYVAVMLVDAFKQAEIDVEIVGSNKRYTDPDVPHFACEIDFEVRIEGSDEITNVELKTVSQFVASQWGESGSDDTPSHYTAQVMWGLGVTRRRKGILAALIGLDELRIYNIAAEDPTIEWMRDSGLKFWNEHVLTRVPPEPINSADCDRIYRPGFGPALVVSDPETTQAILRLRALNAESKAREAEQELLEFQVKRVMRDATDLVIEGTKYGATWANRTSTYLDQGALKAALPKVHREFTRSRSTRVLTVK